MPAQKIMKHQRTSVVISGMPSVGKTTAAQEIAKEFHLAHLAGGDMLKQMAISRGYKPSKSDWWDTPDGLMFLSERSKNAKFDKEVDMKLIEKIEEGGVVVTSYPIPWIFKDGLKIWLGASQKTRAIRLAGRDFIPFSVALNVIKRRDLENKRLYRKLYGIEFGGDLSVFNFKIDTESISAKQVARLSVQLVRDYDFSRRKTKERDGSIRK